MKTFAILVLSLGMACAGEQQHEAPLVPDSATAIELAKVLLRTVYGAHFVREKAFAASERNGVWIIIGKPRAPEGKKIAGGIIEIRMNAADVRVTYVNLQL
jgi:hypothetical protein